MYFEDPHVLMEVTRRPELILFYFLNKYLPGRRSKIALTVQNCQAQVQVQVPGQVQVRSQVRSRRSKVPGLKDLDLG